MTIPRYDVTRFWIWGEFNCVIILCVNIFNWLNTHKYKHARTVTSNGNLPTRTLCPERERERDCKFRAERRARHISNLHGSKTFETGGGGGEGRWAEGRGGGDGGGDASNFQLRCIH